MHHSHSSKLLFIQEPTVGCT